MGSASQITFILAIFVLIAGAISYVIKKTANKYPSVSTNNSEISGVGGWLLFLVFSFMFLSPALGVGRINAEFLSSESQYPNIVTITAWGTYKTAVWWTFLIASSLSFYAGLGLVTGRNILVVRRAKILLWVIGPAASLVMGILLPLLIFGEPEPDPRFIGGMIASIFSAVIWTAYLSKSKRVRATYGTNKSFTTNSEPSPMKPDNPKPTSIPDKPKISKPEDVTGVGMATQIHEDLSDTPINSSETEMYELAWNEIEDNEINKGLWARAFSESAGDGNKARARYIEYRVNQLKEEDEIKKHNVVQAKEGNTIKYLQGQGLGVMNYYDVERLKDYLNQNGVKIFGIEPKSIADNTDMELGDIIVSYDHVHIRNHISNLTEMTKKSMHNEKYSVLILRDNKFIELLVDGGKLGISII